MGEDKNAPEMMELFGSRNVGKRFNVIEK